MAAETFRLEIAAPERMLVNEAVTEASIPGEQGVLGILPGHAPLLSELGSGELSYTMLNGQRHFMAVQGGYIEISGNHVCAWRPIAPSTPTRSTSRAPRRR